MSEKILELVDNIKQKITDKEYMDMMESLKELYDRKIYEVTLMSLDIDKRYNKQLNIRNTITIKNLKLEGEFDIGDNVWIEDNIMKNTRTMTNIRFDLNRKDDDSDDDDCSNCSSDVKVVYKKYTYISHKKIEV
tara:strand:+ start:539 stop:940 length:402 start_codon:yes stop_codon:yes gene_type:complete